MKIKILWLLVLANFVYGDSSNSTKIVAPIINAFAPQLDYSTIKIVFYYGATRATNKTYLLADATDILGDTNFDRHKKTVLYCHGYSESLERTSVKTIVDAYIARGDHNILVLDWESFAAANFFTNALPSAFALGPVMARKIIQMYENGLTVANLHIVGHSLGGQLVGLIGENVDEISKQVYKVNRITGLDPSLPGFYPSINTPINRFVAEFVDIIHTDAGIFGAPVSTGSVDFWPNGGRSTQPGCPIATWQYFVESDSTEFCSHHRSWRFWAESVANKNQTFHAIQAKSYFLYTFGESQAGPVQAYMGIDASPTLVGNYYLQTNSESPYSRDESGMKYQGWFNGFG